MTIIRRATAKQARKILLSGSQVIIEDLIRCATGEKDPTDPKGKRVSVDENARAIYLDAIIPMLQQVGDTQRLRAGSTADVIKMVARGKITIAEAKELMCIMQADFEVNQLPELLEKFESLQK